MDPNGIATQLAQVDQSYNPTQAYNNALGVLGVSDARTRVQGLRTAMLNNENLLNNVDSSVTGRTSGQLVTEAQRQRLVAAEKTPLAQTQATLSGSFNSADANLTDLLHQADSEVGRQDLAYKSKRQGLADQLSIAQKSQSDAEQKRQFDVAEANKVAASKASGGSSGSGSQSNPSAQDIIKYYVSAPSQYGAYNAGSTNYHRWQAAEQALQEAGYSPQSAAMKKLTTAAFGSPQERKALGV